MSLNLAKRGCKCLLEHLARGSAIGAARKNGVLQQQRIIDILMLHAWHPASKTDHVTCEGRHCRDRTSSPGAPAPSTTPSHDPSGLPAPTSSGTSSRLRTSIGVQGPHPRVVLNGPAFNAFCLRWHERCMHMQPACMYWQECMQSQLDKATKKHAVTGAHREVCWCHDSTLQVVRRMLAWTP